MNKNVTIALIIMIVAGLLMNKLIGGEHTATKSTPAEVSKVPRGLPMNLLVAVDSPAQLGEIVQLQDAAGCRYAGKLEQRNGEPESTIVKLMNQANGNIGSWSIAIFSKTCGSIQEDAALVVPLRNIISKDGYAAGTAVNAYLEATQKH